MPPRGKTIAELNRELRAKRAQLAKVRTQRTRVARRLAKLDRQMAALTGGDGRLAGPGRRGRAGARVVRRRRAKGKPLSQYISQVLAGTKNGMRVKDIQKAVVEAGYRSGSKNFYGLVAAALRDESKFKNLRRGVYKNAG